LTARNGIVKDKGKDKQQSIPLERNGILSLDKGSAEATELLAGQTFASDAPKAVKLYQKAARLFRERGDEKNSGRLLNIAAAIVADDGWEYKEKGDLVRARQKALKALEIHPHHVDARNILGLMCLDKFEYAEAEGIYARAIADAIAEQSGDVKMKGDSYWVETGTRPYMRARQGYGFCLAYLGRHGEALDQFKLLLELDPQDHMGARFLLADLYHFIDDREYAEKCYKEHGSFYGAFTYALLLHKHGRESESRIMLKKAFNNSPLTRSMLTDYLYCFVLWETLSAYEWGTFPPLRLHRNALVTAWNKNAHTIVDYETESQGEAAYNFCKLCGPLWLKYRDSYAFLKEGRPAG
jgi:tetratricopeptide (TPR) repeat protein